MRAAEVDGGLSGTWRTRSSPIRSSARFVESSSLWSTTTISSGRASPARIALTTAAVRKGRSSVGTTTETVGSVSPAALIGQGLADERVEGV